MTIERAFLFDIVRRRPFGGRLTRTQVAGCTAILDHWETNHADAPARWLAYILATAYHETAQRMEAIDEYGGAAYFDRRYGPQTAVGRMLGNVAPGDGARFHGRGFVQLTGRANYADWSTRLGLDLVGEPDLALRTDIAARILVDGCVLGTFTGRSLGDYFTPRDSDWYHARRTVNRLDCAAHIAGLAKQFWAGISYAGSGRSGQAKFRPVLRRGATGEDVRFLQSLLDVVEDGLFGTRTALAVCSFQRANRLGEDAVVGLATWSRLLDRDAREAR